MVVRLFFYDQYWPRYCDFKNFYSNYGYIEDFWSIFRKLTLKPEVLHKIYGPNVDLRLKIS